MKNKHIVFDLDGTLTESRTLITREMSSELKYLVENMYDVVVISGAQKSQMLNQIPWLDDSVITVMGQSGNEVTLNGGKVWESCLTFDDLNEIMKHAEKYLNSVQNDQIEIRGGQVSVSLLGHNSDKKLKKSFDPDGAHRRKILEESPFKSDDLIVRVAGTTCFDYTRNGWGKRGNLTRLFENNNWELGDAIYIGDQLCKGGNDEDVKDIMSTFAVEGPEETLKFINLLKNYE